MAHQAAQSVNTAIFIAAAGDTNATTATWTKIGHVTEFDLGEDSSDDIEVTDFSSPANTKEYIGGPNDTGEASVTVNLEFNDATQATLFALSQSKEERLFKIEDTYKNATNVDEVKAESFKAYVKGVTRARQVNSVKVATFTLKRTGPVEAVP